MRNPNSIRQRLITGVALFLALVLGVSAMATYLYFKQQIRDQAMVQQFASLTRIARGLDDKLGSIHGALISVAQVLPHAALHDVDAAQAWLDDRVGIRSLFNNGLFIFGPDGRLVVEHPQLPGRRGMDFSYREYFRRTVETGKPTISKPYRSSKTGHPTVMMTAPVFDERDRLLGILGGAVDLLVANSLFSDLTEARYGRTGYFFMYAPDRTMILHPDPDRIMKQDVPAGANALYDDALAGWEGSGETLNSRGLPSISSFKKLSATDWILAVNLPQEEAYEPVSRFRIFYLGGMALVLLAAVGGSWWLGSRITIDLHRLTSAIGGMDPEQLQRIEASGDNESDEVRQLTRVFNRLIGQIEQDKEQLRQSRAELERHRGQLEVEVATRTAELVEAKEAAEAANRAKSTFLTNMSHELRTPMNGVLGMARLVRRGGVTPKQADQLNKLDVAGRHLVEIINAILDLSKIDAGKVSLEAIAVSLDAITADAAAMLAPSAEVKALQLSVENAVQPCTLIGDPTRLKQALLNYAGNAVKFTDQGRVILRSRIVEETPGDVLVRFEVVDTGIGIDPAVAEQLFHPFEQADGSTTRKYGGTGLGLVITKKLAELMGGAAGVSSVPGAGSTFWFTARLAKGTA
ncbi:MAG: Cache 3/Cache 2 fusion domain-containing protein [Rhodocyclaceae bacterium]|nr:Cache 3/Cache 2 fusion domain-containing protein [Rhodocyclaceae bacterium]